METWQQPLPSLAIGAWGGCFGRSTVHPPTASPRGCTPLVTNIYADASFLTQEPLKLQRNHAACRERERKELLAEAGGEVQRLEQRVHVAGGTLVDQPDQGVVGASCRSGSPWHFLPCTRCFGRAAACGTAAWLLVGIVVRPEKVCKSKLKVIHRCALWQASRVVLSQLQFFFF